MWTPLQTAQRSQEASLERHHPALPQPTQHQILLGQPSLQVQKRPLPGMRGLACNPCHAPASRRAVRIRAVISHVLQDGCMPLCEETQRQFTSRAGRVPAAWEPERMPLVREECGCAGNVPAQTPQPTQSPSPAQQDAAPASSTSSVHLPNMPSADRLAPPLGIFWRRQSLLACDVHIRGVVGCLGLC